MSDPELDRLKQVMRNIAQEVHQAHHGPPEFTGEEKEAIVQAGEIIHKASYSPQATQFSPEFWTAAGMLWAVAMRLGEGTWETCSQGICRDTLTALNRTP